MDCIKHFIKEITTQSLHSLQPKILLAHQKILKINSHLDNQ